jgi:alpha-L-fucosidase
MVTFHPGPPGQLSQKRPFDLASPDAFTPFNLDTDQWAKAQASFGAKYSVLNVKDESGFLLWPSKCGYNYTIAETPGE